MKKSILTFVLLISLITVFAQPSGTIIAYGGTKESLVSMEKLGWIVCDGSLYDRTLDKYKNLFNNIGTSWGGDGGNKFAVPDLRGMFLRGVSDNTGADPDALTRSKSRTDLNSSGNGGDAVGSKQKEEIRSHTHGYTDAQFAEYNCGTPPKTLQGNNGNWDYDNGRCTTDQTTSATGGNETRPKNAYVYYLIKL